MSQHHADHPSRKPSRPTPIRELPRFRLILHSGGFDNILFVVRTIMELTRFCLTEATHKTWEAHNYGRALLLITYRERAELLVERFADRGLDVSIEPTS